MGVITAVFHAAGNSASMIDQFTILHIEGINEALCVMCPYVSTFLSRHNQITDCCSLMYKIFSSLTTTFSSHRRLEWGNYSLI